MKRGFFIGRFQPFHKGHLKCIKDALNEVEHIIIGIGSSQYSDVKENPFTADERAEMIQAALKQENITDYTIFFVPDINNDEIWVKHVEGLIPDFQIVYTGNDHTAKLFEEKGYGINIVNFVEGVNGTSIRDAMVKGDEWEKLVPEPVLEILNNIKAVKTLKKIFR